MSVSQRSSMLASLTRLYPFFSGCGTLANHRLMRILAPDSSNEFVWAKCAGGELRVSLDDYVGRAIFFFGDLDPKITWILKRLLYPGDRVLDVGANVGLLTLWMSRLVGPQGFVHAFEPNPVLCQILNDTFARNATMNVKLHSIALGSSSGQVKLHVPTGNFGGGSLVRKTGQTAQIHTVSVMKLDDVVVRESISKIALIKLDVEGFELEVLRGARRVVQELRPAAILFEANERSTHRQLSPVMQFLHDYDYEFLMIPRCLAWMKTKVVDSNRPDVFGHDLIAGLRGKTFARMRQQLRAD
jgi:FkbM family methyltransferase